LPNQAAVTKSTDSVIRKFVDKEIQPQVSAMKVQLTKSQDDPRYRNSLGLVYARYGRYDEALVEFLAVLKKTEYIPALINTGNINFLQGYFAKAIKLYDRVLARNDQNMAALPGSAHCNFELENYGSARKAYQTIQSVDPTLAQQFAYLALEGDATTRASDAQAVKTIVAWEGD
jgi:tetratricopeptide (TPR) repeat protein